MHDIIIVGAGPAGLAAGSYAGRARLDTLIIEKQKDGGQIVITDELRTGFGRSSRFVALRKHEDADLLTGTVRQNDRAADLLVGVTAVNAEFHVHFDGFVELGLTGLHGEVKRFGNVIKIGGVDQFRTVDIFLTMFH